MYEWLTALKAGDLVILLGSGMRKHDAVGVVERVTKTLVIIRGGSARYRKSDGYSTHTTVWSMYGIGEATLEKVEKIRERELRQKLINCIERTDLNNIPKFVLQKVVDLFESCK